MKIGENLKEPSATSQGMTDAHEIHLQGIQAEIVRALELKYRKGQQEHGGSLWSKGTIHNWKNSWDEATDMVTYLFTMRQHLVIILNLAKEGMDDQSLAAATSRENCKIIYNILTGHNNNK